ncbi:hypothetical protein, conserved [Eimeria necatrix]|uniref:Uncharacterized protein n=1 Tax=Eimeria necatrix TaxID=51315 RepID=U6MQF3_9EIME|nr:hypothetical protein, conserved [Eimeria necatrix]CDJ65308.1 hypothetical protein, conserved [Eimeria necatrix]
MTCVFPLSVAVYIHPVLFSRAFRFVESRYNRRKPASGLLASDRHLEPLFLSHLCWAFLVAEMHHKPFFSNLLNMALAKMPLRFHGCVAADEGVPSLDQQLVQVAAVAPSEFAAGGPAPWCIRDIAVIRAVQQNSTSGSYAAAKRSDVTPGDLAAPARRATSEDSFTLTPLDCITYRNHCDPAILLQQVCRLLQLEAPQLETTLEQQQQQTFKAYCGAVIRWRGSRQSSLREFLEEVKVAASDATLKWSVAGEGAIQSAAPEFGHQWPLSEVCLWVQGVPLVLLLETEGLSLNATPEDAMRNYSTGYKYLLLRAFRALGVSKILFINSQEWQGAKGRQQKACLLRQKFAV